MKEFLKYTLAVIVGIHISAFLLLFIGAGILGAMVASKSSSFKTQPNSFLVLNLDGELTERHQESPLDLVFGSTLKKQGLDQILESIEIARVNTDITGIYLDAGNLEASTASLQEIRNALKRFREAGKTVIAYGDHYSQGVYFLSSVSDKVFLNPAGSIEWKGIAAQTFFYKDLLEKLGVQIQMFRVGDFKSAVEPFTRNSMSEESKLQYGALIRTLWDEIASEVSASRQIPLDSLNQFADKGLFFAPAEDFVTTGMVDSLLYRDEVRSYLKQLTKTDRKERPRLVTVEEMVRTNEIKPSRDKEIAIYYAYGEIDGMVSPKEGIHSKKIIEDLRKLQENDKVRAVVLRVNSPGGSAYGSEQIWKAVSDLNKAKPVIVSMGDYAASGGYYISAAATAIVAQPTTLTGSIGIYGIVPSFEKTGDKLGIQHDRVTTHAYSDLYSVTRPFSASERRLMQQMLERGYNLFLSRCAEGRDMQEEEVNKIAQGHVWSGVKAKELNLVDALGGIPEAVAMAAEKAEIKEYSLKKYPKEKSFIESLLEEEPLLELKNKFMRAFPGYPFTEQVEKEMRQSDRFHPQMRVPFQLVME